MRPPMERERLHPNHGTRTYRRSPPSWLADVFPVLAGSGAFARHLTKIRNKTPSDPRNCFIDELYPVIISSKYSNQWVGVTGGVAGGRVGKGVEPKSEYFYASPKLPAHGTWAASSMAGWLISLAWCGAVNKAGSARGNGPLLIMPTTAWLWGMRCGGGLQ